MTALTPEQEARVRQSDNDNSITRAEADLMGLTFLARTGGDRMGAIETEEELAAALLYIDLKKKGFAHSDSPEPGVVVWTITDAGRAELARAGIAA